MSRQERIKNILIESLTPVEFEISNESHMHSGPRTESHYKVFLVSQKFEGLSRVERQQSVYALLGEEFDGGLHAISMRLKTPAEVAKFANEFSSPECSHKPKKS